MKKFILISFLFSSLFFNPFLKNELAAQTVTTTITYGGFQACGGCTVCGADYWCFNQVSSYCGNTIACGTQNFFDPVPAGNIVTNISIAYYTADCYGSSITATINGNVFPTVNEGNTGCLCSNSPCAVSATTGATFPCGVPAYNYGALNSFQLCTGAGVCVNRVVLTMTYAPVNQATPATQPGAISGNAAVCTGVGNVYSIPAVANASSYTWSVPAGWTINSGQGSTSITATPGGAGNICVTASNLCGTSASTCTPITISTPSTAPTGATATPNPICSGSSTTLSVSGGALGVGASWNWYSGSCGGTFVGSGSSISVSPGSTTTYYVLAQGTCNTTSCASTTVTVNPTVTASWTNPSNICAAAGSINLNPLITGTAGGTWSGTGVSGTTFNPASGTQSVTYTVGLAPCTQTSTQTITVVPDVNPAWTNPSTICAAAGSINLNSLITGTAGGTWSGIGVSGTTFDPSSGTQNVTYTVGTAPCVETSTLTITVAPDVNPSWTNPSNICAAAGSINLNPLITGTVGGTWSGTGVSGTTFNPASGTQSVTYTVGTAPCQETSTQTITVIPDVNPSWTNPSPICSAAGSINLNSLITGTAGGTWSGTGVSGTTFDPSSGTQNITYTVGTAPCVETSTLTITVVPDVDPTWMNPSPICAAAGSINLNSLITGTAGGTWSGTGVSGNTFDPTVGSQNVTYTVGTAPCVETLTFMITVSAFDATWTNPGPICDGATPINLNTYVTGSGGGTFTGTGVTGNTFDPSSGTQSVTYTVGTVPCVETSTLTITVNPDATITLTSAVGTDAQTVCINTAITNITYTIGGGGTGAGVTGLPAGVTGLFSGGIFTISGTPTVSGPFNYTVTTTGTCGQVTATGTITVNPAPTTANSGAPQTICATTGSVTMAGNTPAIGIGSWSQISGPVSGTITTPGSTTTTITGLTTPGAYVFQWSITNAPCTPSTSNVTITVNPAPTIANAGLSQTICSSVGTSTMAADSAIIGVGTWTQVGGPVATITDATLYNTTITGMSAAGTYVFQWSIANSPCANSTDTVSVVVNANPTFAIGTLVNPSGCGLTDGSITLTGLTPSTSYNITYNDGSTVNLGTVTTTAGGDYVITGLDAGTYTTFTVTNASNCATTVAGPASLVDPSAPSGVAGSSFTDPTTCSGSDGTITISGLDSSSTYDITYSDGFSVITLTGVTTTAGGTYVITGLSAGTYSGFSLMQSGCTGSATGSITLNNPTSPSFTSGATFTNPSSCGAADGTITISGLLASTTYTFSYDGPLGNVVVGTITTDASGDYVLTNLTAGAYTNFVITASNLCSTTSTTSVILVDPSAPVFTPGSSFSDPTTCNGTDGTITISGLNPSTTYDITYNGPLGTINLTGVTTTAGGTYQITGLEDGVYDSFVISLSGCNGSSSVTVTLTDPALPTFSAGTTSTNPTTCGGSDGTITITGLTPSTVYTISYTGPSGVVNLGSVSTDASGDYIITGLPAGSYFDFSVSITGCTTIDAVTVVNLTDPGAPTFTITGSGTNPTTCGGSDGTFSITGLSPNTTYDFIYDNGSIVTVTGTTDASGNYTVTSLSAGTYTNISVSLSGCTSVNSTTITLVDPAGPIVTAVSSNTVCVGSTINFLPSTGGTWTSNDISVATIDNSGVVTGISAGTTTVVFTDTVTGCTSNSSSGLITVNDLPIVSTTSGGVVCAGSTINFTPSTGGMWTSSNPSVATIDNSGLVTGISIGTANMVFTDGTTGCQSTISSGLVNVGGIIASFTATPTTGLVPLDVIFSNTGSSGPGYIYTWNFGDGQGSSIENPTHTYTDINLFTVSLTVSDGSSCQANYTVIIEVIGQSSILIPNVFTPNGDGSNDVFTVDGENLESVEAEIFNRWGQKMYEWKHIKGYWDGRTQSGIEAPDGTYFYIITAKGLDGAEYFKKGGFSLIR